MGGRDRRFPDRQAMAAEPRVMLTGACALALVLAFMLSAHPDEPARDAFPKLRVVGTEFHLTMADGRVLAGLDLVGAVLTVGDTTGDEVPVRIEAIRPDPEDPTGETMVYTFAVEDPHTGLWQNPCAPDA